MGRPVIKTKLGSADRRELLRRVNAATSTQREAFRAGLILECAKGGTTEEIAERAAVSVATVCKWRQRYAESGLAGLTDAPRPGKPPVYDPEGTTKRILSKLDDAPPDGYAQWNGRLLAETLGDVSEHQVWRILREHGIQLQRRTSWCVSTDPEFASKAADVVGVYLSPPENAVVLCVDEKPHIQALQRAQGYLKFADGRAFTGFSHEYKRNGTSTLFAALNIMTGQVVAQHTKRRRRIEFLQFMNEVVADYPGQQIHVVLDNLNTHKPKNDRWLARHKNVHFHFIPTHASWLNMVECWFSILSRSALRGASFASVAELRTAIDKFIEAYNERSHPFVWRKKDVGQKHFTHLCN